MIMLFNILCKAFIFILDILLLDFYLKNIYTQIYKKHLEKLKLYIYFVIFIFMTLYLNNFKSYFLIQIGIIFLLFIIFSFSHINKIDFMKKILIFYFLKSFIQLVTIIFLLWLFNTRTFNFYSQVSINNTFLSHTITTYLTYILLIQTHENQIKYSFRNFKMISIFVFIIFSFIFILNNPILFRTVAIARTYIFTVVISIVALICFDRMQAKYEAEKYSQEAIIQNMKKEKSFNEQRAKRQEEIKKVNHDLVNILAITQSHISDQEYEKAQDYLSKTIQSVVEEYNALNHSGIDSLDGIIQEKMSIMKENGIRYDEEISKLLHFGNIDLDNLVLIIDLALDKAIEEVKQISGEKYIRLTLQSKQTHIILHISHPIDKQHSRFHVHNQSSHHDLAFKQIETITKRYHGDIKYDTTDNEVILRVILEK